MKPKFSGDGILFTHLQIDVDVRKTQTGEQVCSHYLNLQNIGEEKNCSEGKDFKKFV